MNACIDDFVSMVCSLEDSVCILAGSESVCVERVGGEWSKIAGGVSRVKRSLWRGKRKVLPGFEPGIQDSKSGVLTITL